MTDSHELSCPACRAIDRADGIEDGNLSKTEHYHTRHERAMLRSVAQAQDRAADRVTAFAGSLLFVYIHAAWFTMWILFNVGAFGLSREFDPFPFGLLTMVVSLEAIFLATFVMVTQNRQGRRADIRSELDFETNLRSEIWAGTSAPRSAWTPSTSNTSCARPSRVRARNSIRSKDTRRRRARRTQPRRPEGPTGSPF